MQLQFTVNHTEKKRKPVAFHEWQRRPNAPNTDEEKKWQTMDRTVWEIHRVKLDSVLFRSEFGQNRKKKEMKTDNSFIMGWTDVSRDNITEAEQCYGVIERLYLHFMYPPGIN